MLRLSSLAALVLMIALPHAVLADPVDGPISGVARVRALSINEHRVLYKGGEQADFKIVGDGDTTLNVVVVDESGVVVVRTTGPGDRCHVKWTPRRSSYFVVRVMNEGNFYNEYRWYAF